MCLGLQAVPSNWVLPPFIFLIISRVMLCQKNEGKFRGWLDPANEHYMEHCCCMLLGKSPRIGRGGTFLWVVSKLELTLLAIIALVAMI